MRHIIIIILTFCFALQAIGQIPSSINSKIDSFLTEQIKEHHIPALSVAIVENGKIKHMKSYGQVDIQNSVANTPEKAFQLASVTKLLSATAIAILIDQGKLKLENPVSFYLSDVPESWKDMKVKDLVAHQTGIKDVLAMKKEFNSLEEAWGFVIKQPLDFKPGTKTVYAGGDYAVVMKLIESVTGMPFQEYIQISVFNKLGMSHTGFNNMEQDYIYRKYDILPYAATTYEWNHELQKQRVFSMLFPKWTYPSGGLYASLEDLCTWIIALDSNTLLSEKVQDLMWTPTELRDGTKSPFGVGWIIDKFNDEKITGHSGGPALADIMRLPGRKISVIVLTNQVALRPFLTSSVLKFYMESDN